MKTDAKAFRHGAIWQAKTAPGVAVRPVRFDNGVPVYRFRKELIRCGNWETADGVRFEVTPQTLADWSKEFRSMKRAGVPVPVPVAHNRVSGDDNRGRLVEMFPEGKSLVGIIDLYGDEAPRLAASNDVSIYAEPDWTDGKGNRYRWPIRHVALTPDPRIPGLKGFVPIAASNKRSRIPVLTEKIMATKTNKRGAKKSARRIMLDALLAGPGDGAPAPGASTAGDLNAEPTKKGLKAQIKEHFLDKANGAMANEELEHEEKLKAIGELLEEMERILEAFEEEEEEEGDSEEKELEHETGEHGAAMSNEGDKWCAIRKHMGVAASNQLLKLTNDNRLMKIEGLFRDGRITAHQRKMLLERFTGAEAVTLALSNDSAAATFDQTIGVLEQGPKIVSDERTGQQLVLSNPLNDPEADKRRREDEESDAELCRPSGMRRRK